MSAEVLEQPVLGSRRLSNYLVAAAVSIGGIGFLLASLSSYLCLLYTSDAADDA